MAATDTAWTAVRVGAANASVGITASNRRKTRIARGSAREGRGELTGELAELARARERAFFTSRASATTAETVEKDRKGEKEGKEGEGERRGERICICNARDQSPRYLPYPAEMTTIRP